MKWVIVWWSVTIISLVYGFNKIQKDFKNNNKKKLLFIMAGAFCFLVSALKLPSFTGSSSHPTGTGFGTILLGPGAMFVVGFIVLLFQAILLAHGGLTTLGANHVAMGVVGPLFGFLIYAVLKKIKIHPNIIILFTAFTSNIMTYIVTSIQLALAFPSETGGFLQSFYKFLCIFAFTQLPLAVIESLLTLLVINTLRQYAAKELQHLSLFNTHSNETKNRRAKYE